MASLLRRLFSSEIAAADDAEDHPTTDTYQRVGATDAEGQTLVEEQDLEDYDRTSSSTKTMASNSAMKENTLVVVDESLPLPARFHAEFILQLKLAMPIMFTLMCESLPMVVSMSFVGLYTSALHIDAVANAQNIYYVVGVAVGLGMSGALETLATQSRGAGNPLAVGFFLQQGFAVLSLLFIPVSILLFSTEALLLAASQPPEVAALAGEYAIWLIPCTALIYIYELLRRALQAFGVLTPFTIAAFGGLIGQSLGTWYFIAYLGIGFKGAAYGQLLGLLSQVLAVLVYLQWTKEYRHFWDGFDKRALDVRKWGPWWVMGVPGILTIILEWSTFVFYMFFCGWMDHPNENIAAFTIILQISSTNFMLFLGNATAVGLRVGMLLGAGRGSAAKFASSVGITTGIVLGVALSTVMMMLRGPLVRLFLEDTKEVYVGKLARGALVFSSIYATLDSIHAVCGAVFRATSMQSTGAWITFAGFWIVGLPVGYFMGLTPYSWIPGINGLVLSLSFALMSAIVLDFWLIFKKIDWDLLANVVAENRKLEEVTVVTYSDKNVVSTDTKEVELMVVAS